MQNIQRLPSITGDEPTAASVQRYQKRVQDAFMPPKAKRGESDDDYRARYAHEMVFTQKRVAPPKLPIIGHGTQLANIRLSNVISLHPAPVIDPDSRQVVRRVELKKRKAARSAANKLAIKHRRNKKSA